MPTVVEQLEAMRSVPENWDGYGGAAPQSAAIEAALRFLRPLLADGALPEPYVTPTPAGGVLLVWQQGPHQLEVAIRDGDRGSFVYLDQVIAPPSPAIPISRPPKEFLRSGSPIDGPIRAVATR